MEPVSVRIAPFLIRGLGLGGAYLTMALLMSGLNPASFALPIFPSSGIALAGLLVFGQQYWPAIWAAGFAFAAYSVSQLTGDLGVQGWVGAALAATGASLQAVAGGWLIRRLVGFPTTLDTPRDIGLFLTLGGPASCLIGVSMSVGGFVLLGLLAAREWFPHWVGWWLGDSIGVLIGAPLTLIAIARPRAIWRPRLFSVAPLLVLSAMLIASLMFQVAPLDVRQHRSGFERESHRLRGVVQHRIANAGDWLDWAARTVDASGPTLDREELTNVVRTLHHTYPAIRGLFWLTRRAAAHSGQLDGPTASIFANWSVDFAEPLAERKMLTDGGAVLESSLDALRKRFSARPDVRAALLTVGLLRTATAQEIAILRPVYRKSERRSLGGADGALEFLGFLVLTLDLADTAVMPNPPHRDLRWCLSLHEGVVERNGEVDPGVCLPSELPDGFRIDYPLELGWQRGTLHVGAPARSIVGERFDLRSSALLLSSLLLTGLFTASLLVLSGTNRRVQEIVADRTRRLDLAARVFDSTAEGIAITDAGSRIISINPAFTAITGYQPDEVLGKDPKAFGVGELDAGYFGSVWETLAEQDRWQGEVWHRRKSGEAFPALMTISSARDEEGRVLHYIATFTDISQQKQAAEHIHHLAYFDALTGLANRSLLELRGEQAIASAEQRCHLLAVLFLDVDRFKTVNDSLGHLAGDELLQSIADRLRDAVRDEDTVARIGGDEFVVLLAELSRRQDAALVARKITDALVSPTVIENQEISVTASIGISLYPYDGQDFPTLVKNADVALYKAKEEGRNNFRFFEAAMSAQSFERLVLENALRSALDRDELTLYFQPQVNIATGLVVGAEALLRWSHPQMGLIAPNRFIRVAEESGMIAAIGEWVIRTVCTSLAQWEVEGVPLTTIAVNISALQFKHELAEMVRKALDESGVSPRLIELELTESLLMSSADDSVRTLRKLHRMGVRLSIDDFGTGYSSLSYLKRFPIHKLKIDQSFIREIPGDSNDEAITRTIIGLANNLHLRVVAEGVETQAQTDFLYSVGCHEIQGSHVARPMPSVEFAAWMTERGRRRYPVV